MDRVCVATPLCVFVGLEKGDVVCLGRVTVDALNAHVHRANIYIQLFNLRKEIEQMMRGQRQLSRFHTVRLKVQASKGERGGKSARGGVTIPGGAG